MFLNTYTNEFDGIITSIDQSERWLGIIEDKVNLTLLVNK